MSKDQPPYGIPEPEPEPEPEQEENLFLTHELTKTVFILEEKKRILAEEYTKADQLLKKIAKSIPEHIPFLARVQCETVYEIMKIREAFK